LDCKNFKVKLKEKRGGILSFNALIQLGFPEKFIFKENGQNHPTKYYRDVKPRSIVHP
jgi:hypothetical protein